MARQRPGLTWLNLGETNTSYFHIDASDRRKNFISHLKENDLIVTNHKDLEEVLLNTSVRESAGPCTDHMTGLDFLGLNQLDLSGLDP